MAIAPDVVMFKLPIDYAAQSNVVQDQGLVMLMSTVC